MNTEEVFKLANAAAPELMERTAATISELVEEAPEMVEPLYDDFRTIVARTSEGVEKTAGFADHLKSTGSAIYNAGKSVLTADATKRVGIAAGAALGVAVATDLYDAAKRGLTRGNSYKRMIETNPDLRKHDQKQVRDAFDSLHRFAPDMAADPMFAGSMVESLVQIPQGAAKTLTDAIQARKNLSDVKRGHLGLTPKDLIGVLIAKKDGSEMPALKNLERNLAEWTLRREKRGRPY